MKRDVFTFEHKSTSFIRKKLQRNSQDQKLIEKKLKEKTPENQPPLRKYSTQSQEKQKQVKY